MNQSESTTTTRRRAAAVGSSSAAGVDETESDDTVLELSRWKLNEPEEFDEMEPLAAARSSEEGGVPDDDEESNIGSRRQNARKDDDAPLTVKLNDYIQPDQEEEYLTWQRGISNAMEEAVGRDNVGSILLREILSDGRIRFVILFRFRNRSSAVLWHTSEIRRTWLRKLMETTFHNRDDPGHYELSASSSHPVPMFDVTNPIPDDVSFTTSAQPRPQRWRTAFLVWMQVFLLVELFGILLPLILGHARWFSINFHFQLVVSTAITTIVIEAFTMQLFVRAARVIRFLKS